MLLLAALTGCPSTPELTAPLSTSRLGESVTLEGRAIAPTGLLAKATNSAIVPGNATFDLLALDEGAIAGAIATLSAPNEQFYKTGGQLAAVVTDSNGRYRFNAGVPRGLPVIVSVNLPERRRVTGLIVPEAGPNKLDLSLSTTVVTEFLRQRAIALGKDLTSFSLVRLTDLINRTSAIFNAGKLSQPDLATGKIDALTLSYSVVVGQNTDGLGDAWKTMLGVRTVAAVTIAGATGIAGAGGDGGPARNAELYQPTGLCTDRAGNTFIADTGNHKIRRIDKATGRISTLAGTGTAGFAGDGGPGSLAWLNRPLGVALDRDQLRLFIFDSENARIRALDLVTGTITTFAGDPIAGLPGFWVGGHDGDFGPAKRAKLFFPRSGVVDTQGNLYVVDARENSAFHTIRRITPDGTITTYAGTPGARPGYNGDNRLAEQALFNDPRQVAITPDDQLYVADTGNGLVRKIDLRTRLVVTMAGVPEVQATTLSAEGRKATSTSLGHPTGVAVDSDGRIYIGEFDHDRVRYVDEAGVLRPLLGGGNALGDGDATRLSISKPQDLAIEPDGNLLVADTHHARLRRVLTQAGL